MAPLRFDNIGFTTGFKVSLTYLKTVKGNTNKGDRVSQQIAVETVTPVVIAVYQYVP